MSAETVLLGIDLGTESARAVLFDVTGRQRGQGSRSYSTRFPQTGWAEQDPYEIWTALINAVREALLSCPEAQVIGCSIATTAVTVLPVDMVGNPLGPAILWMDTRAAREADEINATEHNVLQYTGGRVSPEWMLPKALWLRRHNPDLYHRARHIVEVHDWVMYHLTGRWALSLSTINAEWTHAEAHGGWPLDLLASLGLEDLVAKWPDRILSPGEPVGEITLEAARATGLPEDLPVAQGLMDSYAAALATDVFYPGRLSFSLGSSSCFLALVERPITDRRLLGPVPDAFGRGPWAVQGGQTSAGATLRWFRNELAPNASYTVLDAEAATLPAGSDGVHALETMQGSRTPYRDPSMRGAFWGLNLAHRRSHLYRALLEAVAYGGRQVVETMEEAGVHIDHVVACGGGSRSELWMQIHADVLNRAITVTQEPSAAALGAAICGAVGAGAYPDLASAAHAMAQRGRTYWPTPDNRTVYDSGYGAYVQR